MNKFLIFLGIIVISSCDPPTILIVENRTSDTLHFSVNTFEPITFESIYVSDTLIPDEQIGLNSIPKLFNRHLTINRLDSLNYLFDLNPNNEVLISPSTIRMPFRTVTYEQAGSEKVIIGEDATDNPNFEIKFKPLKTTIVKIN